MPLPEGLTLKQAMGIGTAGFTAMLAVMALEAHSIDPAKEVLVTGAAGGGQPGRCTFSPAGLPGGGLHGPLAGRSLSEIVGGSRNTGSRGAQCTQQTPRVRTLWWGGGHRGWGGAGRGAAAHGLRRQRGGLWQRRGARLETTVFPFILRGVNLLGIDSVMCPKEKRLLAWQRLARELPKPLLEATLQTVSLEEVPALAQAILQGQVRGRVVVKLD